MYIPINFLASNLSCANALFSGSTVPNSGSTEPYGRIGSGSDEAYFFIKTEVGESITFNINGGTTSQAKLLLVGGGGYSNAFGPDPIDDTSYSAGGGAGQYRFQDIELQPGITYFMSSSASGGTVSAQTGGESLFITNFVADPAFHTAISASGGQSSTDEDGGTSGDGFSGGTGDASGPGGGGGGGGSTSAGENGSNAGGGDGGSGSFLAAPFSLALDNNFTTGTKLAAGGPGDGRDGGTDGSYPPGVPVDAPGNGGKGTKTGGDGKDGIAILFIPINTCELTPTGSIVLGVETPQAIGGDIVGTFTSASRDYRYHLFTQENGYLNFQTGSTTEGKMLLVGGGAYGGGIARAGGGGAGGVAIKRNQTLYGTLKVTAGPSGSSGNTRGRDSVVTSLSNYIYQVRAVGGGRGATDVDSAEQGGSGGGGYGTTNNGASSINCTDTLFCTADEYFGNAGGDGSGTTTKYGGGGGGAGSVGEDGGPTTGLGGSGYTLTDEFFPSQSLFVSSSVARGGSRRGLSQGYVSEPNSGDGQGEGSPAQQGFVCITYPIT